MSDSVLNALQIFCHFIKVHVTLIKVPKIMGKTLPHFSDRKLR